MSSTELDKIFKWLIDNIFQNYNVMYNDNIRNVYPDELMKLDEPFDLVEVIASLANLLYEEVHGEPYDYFFHWANKIGSFVEEDFFNHIMRGE